MKVNAYLFLFLNKYNSAIFKAKNLTFCIEVHLDSF